MLLDRLATASTVLRRPAAIGRRWLVLPLGLGLALAGTAAYAAIPGASGTISGCVSAGELRGQHVLTLLDTAQASTCQPGQTPITWNQTGPQGPKGDPGAAGPPGAPGPQGPSGPTNDAIGFFIVDPGANACTLQYGPSFMHCARVAVGEYQFDLDAPGVGPLPMAVVTAAGVPVTMSLGGGMTSSDGSLHTVLVTARDDVPGFVVLAVSTAAQGATSHAAATNTSQRIVPLPTAVR